MSRHHVHCEAAGGGPCNIELRKEIELRLDDQGLR